MSETIKLGDSSSFAAQTSLGDLGLDNIIGMQEEMDGGAGVSDDPAGPTGPIPDLPSGPSPVHEDPVVPEKRTKKKERSKKGDARDESDTDKKKRLFIKVRKYHKEFKPELKDLKVPKKNCDLEELENHYEIILESLNQSNNVVYETVVGGLPMIEKLCCAKTPLKLKGFSAALMGNPSFLLSLKQINIEYSFMGSSSPEVRFISSILMTGAYIHQVNSYKERCERIAGSSMPPSSMPPSSSRTLPPSSKTPEKKTGWTDDSIKDGESLDNGGLTGSTGWIGL